MRSRIFAEPSEEPPPRYSTTILHTSAKQGTMQRAQDVVEAFAAAHLPSRCRDVVLIGDSRPYVPVVHTYSRAQWLGSVAECYPSHVRAQVFRSGQVPGSVPFVLLYSKGISCGELVPASRGVA